MDLSFRDEPGLQEQWARFAAMPQEKRVALFLSMSDMALRMRLERLRRTYPDATEAEFKWAVRRDVLGMPPGTEPFV